MKESLKADLDDFFEKTLVLRFSGKKRPKWTQSGFSSFTKKLTKKVTVLHKLKIDLINFWVKSLILTQNEICQTSKVSGDFFIFCTKSKQYKNLTSIGVIF